MNILDKISTFLNRILIWIAGTCLVGMIVLTCANIFCRTVWKPVPGTYELMGLFGSVAAAFALGYTQISRGHISVDVLINTFSGTARKILGMINNTVCLLFFGVAAWQIWKKGTVLFKTGEVTETLRIIYYPFTYAVAFGCLILSLVFFTELVKSLSAGKS
jgi:TRAP-type C4-dicarboxylate transport system permease small subunit